jgi:frataxin
MQHNQIRLFETEAEFHNVADEALETIQDTVDEMLEPKSIDYEINLASGVLTLKMRPHGTWVLNKQTPNRQIWVRYKLLICQGACSRCFESSNRNFVLLM